MKQAFGEYLEDGTKKIIEIASSEDVSEEEKNVLIEAFSNELMNNIGNISNAQEYEPLLYGVFLKYTDRRISSIINDPTVPFSAYDDAIKLCLRQQSLLSLFNENLWIIPSIENQNIEKTIEILKSRQESISLVSRIVDVDRSIDDAYNNAQSSLDVSACDNLIAKVSGLEADLALCKSKKLAIPNIKNKDTKVLRKHITELRAFAERKGAMYQNIYDVDRRIHDLVSLQNTTPEQWQEIVGLCQRQTSNFTECNRSSWPIPRVTYANTSAIAGKYCLYLNMISLDRVLSTEMNSLNTKKEYSCFFADCEKQIQNISICKQSGWPVPLLSVMDPYGVSNVVRSEKNKKDKAKRRKGFFIKSLIFIAFIVTMFCLITYKYREGKKRIPFDLQDVEGRNYKDVYDELKKAGYKNIEELQDNTGWLNSGEVTKVIIDNKDSVEKGDYLDPDVAIKILYSSEDRIYVTELLKGWETKDYHEIEQLLKDKGFNNVILREEGSLDKDKDGLVEYVSLDGKKYTDEECYLWEDAPIEIHHFEFKVSVGNSSLDFVGQDYESVVNDLKERGFTNIQTESIDTGWAKGNTVTEVVVSDIESFDGSEAFDPDVEILVKYSSNDRIDATSILDNWQECEYEQLESSLKEMGFTDITVEQKKTDEKSKNKKVKSVILDDNVFINGECHLRSSTPIVIEYNFLSIELGEIAKNYKKENYSAVADQLRNKGFENIHLLRANNLFLWDPLKMEGKIKSFTINGSSDFAETDSFDYDADIEIVVNTFKKKGCEEITDTTE